MPPSLRATGPRALAVLMLVLLSVTAVAAIAPGQEAIQHGAQPNPGEVRPPSPQGNAPSPSAGTLTSERAPGRLFGVPTGLTLVVAALVVVVGGLWVYSRRPRGEQKTGAQRRRMP